jgi:hypothetical protein
MELKREAVSESIGYLIIFGLILTGIGLITLYGYPLLMQQQSSANMRNMEQTMIVLQNDVKSLTYKLANYKETSLRVSGGSLSLYGFSNTYQKFSISTSDGSINNYVLYPGELRYFSTNDDTVITIENGAVIEKPLTMNGSFSLADPRWYLDSSSSTLVINLMNLSTDSTSSQMLSETGIGTVRMRLLRTNMTSATITSPPNPSVTINYYPDPTNITPDGYSTAWRTYLTNPNNFNGGMSCTGSQPLSCTITNSATQPLQNVIIKEYDVVVETV